MKSIQDQYIALKEGRMSQANFMRNVRMALPQYISNVNSFEDTVRILKNKKILTEATRFQSPGGVDYPGREKQSNYDYGQFGDDLDNELEYYERENPGLINFVNDLKNNNSPEYSDIISSTDDYEKAAQDLVALFQSATTNDAELEDMINRIEDEESGRYTTGGEQFGLNPVRENLSIDEKMIKAKNVALNIYDELPSGYTMSDIKEKANKYIKDSSINKEVASKYINDDWWKEVKKHVDDKKGNIQEAKKKKAKEEKPYNPNAIHPSELRMGIKVEMEHTDDPKKAEKIALDHLAENPYYYTALKLAGVDSPTAPKAKPVVPKKVKKKDATEMKDQANQMQKVKLMKEALEKLIRAELKKY